MEKNTESIRKRYPVILTFKDIKFASWELDFAKIAELLQEEFGRHKELGMSEKLELYEKEYFQKNTGRSGE